MKFRRILSFTLFIVMLVSCMALVIFPLSADVAEAASSAKTVKVGFFAFSGYHIMDESGKRSGYGYEFLQLLARYLDWKFEYVGYEKSYADSVQDLKDGKIDILTSVSWNEERDDVFLFSNKDIGTNSTIFTVKAGNEKVVKDDYATYNGLKIGMLEGNSKNATFKAFADEKGFTYIETFYETESELSAALASGEVDGIVSGSLRAMGDEWLIESLDPQSFYICTSKKRADGQELMDAINVAIEELDLQEPDWRNVLKNKYYSTAKNGEIIVTNEERSWIEEHKDSKLKVLFNPDRKPYSYFENGEAKGIFPALFVKMTEKLGLQYEYVQAKDRKDYYELRKSPDIDIVIDFTDDMFIAEEAGYKITDVYYTTTHTMIKRNDTKGTPTKFATVTYADNYYSGYLEHYVGDGTQYKGYNSLEESINAVKRGDCDATIALSYVAELFIWQDKNNELASELIGEASTSYTIGVNNKEGAHILLSILNKCVAGMDKGTTSSIVNAEVTKFRPNVSGGLIYFLRRNPGYIAVIVAVALILLFAIAMLAVRSVNQRRLKQKIAEATSQLEAQKEELAQALHAADAANRSKTTFLNNMSHDIRTPMNAIIGFTALATTHLDNRERALDYLGKISQASNHLLSLINDVLDMSRIESGKVHIDERPENLADILQGIRNIIQSDIHSKHLELFIDIVDVTNEEIYCDKLRLNQILLNLTSNAIKFTKSGGSVAIKVTQKPSDKEGFGKYEFSVKDTGIGMSKEFVSTVFDPFTRERNSTVSGIQGTGLGMAITKNIVDMMGGEITVESEQGVGTEFCVKLEFKFADADEELMSLNELHGLYSLVVDDDLVSCQSVSKMLRDIGMHAEWTMTGKEAVVRTAEAIELGHPFEVYIIDWAMPDMDGIATVKQIRAIIGNESPIILMSAYDWADIEKEAREAGVTGFVSKPLFASDLHRALERSLGKAPAPVEPEVVNRSFKGKRILLAEDNELNREIAEEILTEAGFEVESAENGKIACEMMEKSDGKYDLVLMDVQMPIMNGYEASKYIRSLPDKRLSEVPIIAMTANAFEEDKANAFAAGMNGHLAKPIDIEKMLALLDSILNGESVDPATENKPPRQNAKGNKQK